MDYWLAVTTIVASIATTLALILSDDFLQFVRNFIDIRFVYNQLISNRFIRYSLLAVVTITLIYAGFKYPNFIGSSFGYNWPPSQGIAQDIQSKRRNLKCGVNGFLDGFSLLRNGYVTGFDADFCRAVAVAVTGNVDQVDFVPLNSEDRFSAVENGRVDVLFRNTSWTVGRDLGRQIDFGPTTFYDKQAIIVPKDSGINNTEDLRNKKICVLNHTTSRKNIERYFSSILNDVNSLPIITIKRDGDKEFTDNQEVFQAYADRGNGICDAVTSDMSQITIYKSKLPDPEEHVILNKINIGQELLSPVYVEGDEKWANIINYVVYATIHATELGITKDNIDYKKSENFVNKQFLGTEEEGTSNNFGEILGIKRDFVYQIIKAVGNYDEIYKRNLEALIPERRHSAVWKHDGLLISPPFTASKGP